ncbi:unnamed protein product [Clonostachys byssicola]|uniref:DUF5624 domain-containing protein n=1 Tax=Clonostachys byssicola TaxID=160290 RepID=A0A9N9UJK4_9HYPO|nr:unnamed protein product [Clonostachys byssicola]
MSTSASLELTQSLLTSGARAAGIILLQASYFLAIPQLARDIPGGTPGMHGGDSGAPLVIYRTNPGTSQSQEYQQLNVPGGEDAEFFQLGDRTFLATASVRSGSDPNHDPNVDSCIFEWDGDKMEEFQCVPTWGGKQWHNFNLAERHFLALAQGHGEIAEQPEAPITINSTIFEWNGDNFEPFQIIPSLMGYNWLHFSLENRDFLAYADQYNLSTIYEWKEDKFVPFQALDGVGGRAFELISAHGRTLLAFSLIGSDSVVYQWAGQSFEHYQTLEGIGGREFALIEDKNTSYLLHIKFLQGSLEDPDTSMTSIIYRVDPDGLKVTGDFATFGGTDVSTFKQDGKTFVVTSESLTEDLRFRQDSHIYQFVTQKSNKTGDAKHSLSQRSHGRFKREDDYVVPEFMSLFSAYTGGPSGIGAKYQNISTDAQATTPLLVATAESMVLYPGNGDDPVVLDYRLGVAGFIELTAVSHLGPAVASLAEVYEAQPESDEWRGLATQLLNATEAARNVNSEALWKDTLKIEAYQGRESKIADMINYACDLTSRLLEAVLADPSKLSVKFIRENYVNVTGGEFNAEVPINKVMTATFFLSALDGAMQTHNVLKDRDIDWTKIMVLINGKIGRQTAGVVMSSKSLAQMFLKSQPELTPDRIYIAPHGTVPNTTDRSVEHLRSYETELRRLWAATRGYVDLSGKMFEGYPAYSVAMSTLPVVNWTTPSVSELPAISGPDDWLALTTSIRVTLEDPRQPLSGSITDYATQTIFEAGWDLTKIVVPGLDNVDYKTAQAKLFT